MKGWTPLERSNTKQKQSFLGGAAVLALATAVVKVIGAIYKIPLKQILGDDGFAYFGTAYEILAVLLMISITGLPAAMSRMISEARTLGQTKQILQIYRVSRTLFLTFGVVGSLGMALICRWLAALMHMEQSWFAILCMSPAVLFIGLLAVERGYFQGQSNMVPTSVSQVLEAVCKLVIGLGLAWAFLRVQKNNGLLTSLPRGSAEAVALTDAHAKAAGLAILGVTLGSAVAWIYMIWQHRKAVAGMREACRDETVFSAKDTARKLLAIAVPITLGAAGLQIITTIDSGVYMARLKGPAGVPEQLADDYKGIYFFAQTIFNLPMAFIGPLAISAIPAITEQLTLHRGRQANTIAESAVRIMSLIAMPCSVGLMVLSEPIMQLLGGYTAENYLGIASNLMRILAACVFFNASVLVMNAILQAGGHAFLPVIHMVAGGIVKLIISFVLVANPNIHIIGVPIGTAVCFALIAFLDYVAIRRVLPNPPRLMENVVKPILASLAMGAVTFVLNSLCETLRLSLLLRTGLSILGAAVAYAVLVVALRIVTRDDCSLLPKGDKIAKLLRIR